MAADSAAEQAFGRGRARRARADRSPETRVAGGWLTQLTPMPMTTRDSPRVTLALDQDAGNFVAGPAARSFGHLSFSRGAERGASARDGIVHARAPRRTTIAARARRAPDRSAAGWRRDCRAPTPRCRPRRPRPALWLSRRDPQRAALAGARKRQRLGIGRAERLVSYVPDPRQARGFAVHLMARDLTENRSRFRDRASEQRFRRHRRRAQQRRRIGEEQHVDQPGDAEHQPQQPGMRWKPFAGSSKYMILTIVR